MQETAGINSIYLGISIVKNHIHMNLTEKKYSLASIHKQITAKHKNVFKDQTQDMMSTIITGLKVMP